MSWKCFVIYKIVIIIYLRNDCGSTLWLTAMCRCGVLTAGRRTAERVEEGGITAGALNLTAVCCCTSNLLLRVGNVETGRCAAVVRGILTEGSITPPHLP